MFTCAPVLLAGASGTLLLDLYQGATAAYSIRKIRTNYSGPALQVRRSTDNSLQDIGFNSDGSLNTSALLSFIGAASGFVKTWYDQSGNSNNISNEVNANHPRIVNAGSLELNNALSALRFIDTVNTTIQNLTSAVFPYSAGSPHVEMFSVYKLNGNGSSPIISGSSANAGIYAGYHSGTTRIPRIATVRTGGLSVANAVSALSLSTTYQRTDYVNRANIVSRIGGSVVINAADRNEDFTMSGNFQIGNGVGVIETDTSISEVIFYASDQSANRAAIEANQKAYFGTP